MSHASAMMHSHMLATGTMRIVGARLSESHVLLSSSNIETIMDAIEMP